MPIRDERQRQQVRASSEARNVALRRLRDAHRDEYDRYYAEECARRYVIARVARPTELSLSASPEARDDAS